MTRYKCSKLIQSCPHCGGLLELTAPPPWNAYDWPEWTDGCERSGTNCVAPSDLVRQEAILKCPHCTALLWREGLAPGANFDAQSSALERNDKWHLMHASSHNARSVRLQSAWSEGEVVFHGMHHERVAVLEPLPPTVRDCQQLLAQENTSADKERERYVRVRLWWHWNDTRRGDSSVTAPPLSDDERTNLFKLSALLDPNDDGDRLLRAEIARELGRFPIATALLDSYFPQHLEAKVKFLSSLIANREIRVRPYKHDMQTGAAKDSFPLHDDLKPPFQRKEIERIGHTPKAVGEYRKQQIPTSVRLRLLHSCINENPELRPWQSMFLHFGQALTYAVLPELSEDSAHEFKKRLRILLITHIEAEQHRTTLHQGQLGQLERELHIMRKEGALRGLRQLLQDIRDQLIDLSRVSPTRYKAYRLPRSTSWESPVIVSCDPNIVSGSGAAKSLHHPAAYCIVWLIQRVRMTCHGFDADDVDHSIPGRIAELARLFIENREPVSRTFCSEDLSSSWCEYVLTHLIDELSASPP